MSLENLIPIILVAVSYYLFSNEFFKFAADIKEIRVSRAVRFAAFIIVYIWFMAASIMELPLTINWFVFLIILGMEVRRVFAFDALVSYTLSLFCIIMGLAVNVFFRSVSAIVLDMPIREFSKTISIFKTYPIFLGFITMTVLLAVLRHRKFARQLKKVLLSKESLIFYAWIEVFIYLFLMVQLLIFTQSGNSMGIKSWGIKASLFSVTILIIASIYSLRVASLNFYMNKQHETRAHLIQEKEDINKLWALAYTDILTGCSNRQLLDKRLEEYAGYGGNITLAFIDVNGLKMINDQYGHMEGDNYLVCVAGVLLKVIEKRNIDLFRYGGDEFVMMSNTCGEEELTKLLAQVNELLKSDKTIQYLRSVSYGVVHGDSMEYRKLIEEADDIMYKHKLKHYEKSVRT